MSRRNKLRPNISDANFFQSSPTVDNKKPTLQRNSKSIDESSISSQNKEKSKISKSLSTLGNDFFAPPTNEEVLNSNSNPSLTRTDKRRSRKSVLPISVVSTPKQKKKTSRREKRKDIIKDIPKINNIDNPVVKLYEEYIEKLYSHIKSQNSSSETIPDSLITKHKDIQQSLQSILRNSNELMMSGAVPINNTFGDYTLMHFSNTDNSYFHFSETIEKRKHILPGKWNIDTAQGGYDNGKKWWKSPQFIIKGDNLSGIRVTLTQSNYHSNIGFHIFPVENMNRAINFPKGAYTSLFNPSTKVQEIVNIDDCNSSKLHVLVICSDQPGDFKLVIESRTDIKVLNVLEWEEWQIVDNWDFQTAGGCRNHDSHINNNQYSMISKCDKPIECCVSVNFSGKELLDELGLYIYNMNKESNNKIDLFSTNILYKTEFASRKQASISFILNPKQSIIITPCTFDQHPCEYELDIFSNNSNCDVKKLSTPDCTEISGEWTTNTAGGCFNHATWIDNTQYTMTINESCKIKLQQDGNLKHSIGFYVLKSNGERIINADWSKINYKTKFEITDTVSLDLPVDKKETFTIIPCTFDPQKFGKYTISIYNSSLKPINIQTVHNPWSDTITASKWSYDTAGGCFNYSTWRNNPQYEFSFPNTTQTVIILQQQENTPDDSIGFYIIENNNESDTSIWELPNSDKLVAKAKFIKANSVSLCFTAKKDKYYTIIPCSFYPNICKTFRLRVFAKTEDKFQLNELVNLALDAGRMCEGEWTSLSAGGSMNNESWPQNPHYLLYGDCDNSEKVIISLSQKTKKLSPIGFAICPADNNGLPKIESIDDIIGHVSYEKMNDVFLEIILPPSSRPFVITPSTFHPGVISKFSLQVFTKEESDIMLMPWTSEVEFYSDDDDIIEDEDDWQELNLSQKPLDFDIQQSTESFGFSEKKLTKTMKEDNSFTSQNTFDTFKLLDDDEHEQQLKTSKLYLDVNFGEDDYDDDIEDSDARNLIAQLRDRIEYLQDEVDSFEETEDTLNKEIEELRTKSTTLQSTIDEQEIKVDSLTRSIAEKEEEKGVLQRIRKQEITRLREKAIEEEKKLQNQLKESNESYKKLENKLQEVMNNTNTIENTLQQEKQEMKKLQLKLDNEKTKVKELENNISLGKEREKGLKDNIQQLNNEIQETNNTINSLKEQYNNEKDNIKSLNDKNELLQKEITLFQSELEKSKNELTSQLSEISNKQFSESQLKEQLQLKEKILCDTQTQIKSLESKEKEYILQINEKESKLKDLQDKIIELKKLNDLLNQKQSLLSNNTNSLTNGLNESKNKIEKLEIQLKEKEDSISKISDKLVNSNKEKQEYENKYNLANTKIQELEEKLQKLTDSLSNIQSQSSEEETKLQESLIQLEENIASSKAENTKLQQALKDKEKEINILKERQSENNNNHEKLIIDYKDEVKNLKTKLNHMKETEKLLQNQLESTTSKLTELESKIEELNKQKEDNTIISPRKESITKAVTKTPEPVSPPTPPPVISIPIPPPVISIPPPNSPSIKKLSNKTKKNKNKTVKKKSILTAIRGGVNLKKTKPENAGTKMKKSWIPFDVDKITQRRHAMEEQDEEEGEAWSDDEWD